MPHIYKHDVTEGEVEDVLLNPGEDCAGRDNSRVAIGQTQSGRYLQVIYIRDPQPNSRSRLNLRDIFSFVVGQFIARSCHILTAKQCDKSHYYEPTLKLKVDALLIVFL